MQLLPLPPATNIMDMISAAYVGHPMAARHKRWGKQTTSVDGAEHRNDARGVLLCLRSTTWRRVRPHPQQAGVNPPPIVVNRWLLCG